MTKEEVKHTPTEMVFAIGGTKWQGEGFGKRELFFIEFGPCDTLSGEIYTDEIGYKEKVEALRRAVNLHEVLIEQLKNAKDFLYAAQHGVEANFAFALQQIDATIAQAEGK